MFVYITRLSGLLFVFFLTLTSCKGKQASEEASPPHDTQIEWKHEQFNFGDITEGEVVSHTFYFTNTGKHNLIIKNIESSCGCTTADYTKAPVKAQGEGKIEIAFNSSGRYGKQYKEISIFANIPEKKTVLKFTANVK